MSSLFYHVHAGCQKKDNLQKLIDLGVFLLFHRRCFKKMPLSGHGFRGPAHYQNCTQSGINRHPDLDANARHKVEVATGLYLLRMAWDGLGWFRWVRMTLKM